MNPRKKEWCPRCKSEDLGFFDRIQQWKYEDVYTEIYETTCKRCNNKFQVRWEYSLEPIQWEFEDD